jgi:hypothetical protein
MPLNERKVIQIILEQRDKIPERCEGYRDELIDSISDIIQAERQHRVQGTRIQQIVSDKCNTSGRFLASKRGQLQDEKEE